MPSWLPSERCKPTKRRMSPLDTDTMWVQLLRQQGAREDSGKTTKRERLPTTDLCPVVVPSRRSAKVGNPAWIAKRCPQVSGFRHQGVGGPGHSSKRPDQGLPGEQGCSWPVLSSDSRNGLAGAIDAYLMRSHCWAHSLPLPAAWSQPGSVKPAILL